VHLVVDRIEQLRAIQSELHQVSVDFVANAFYIRAWAAFGSTGTRGFVRLMLAMSLCAALGARLSLYRPRKMICGMNSRVGSRNSTPSKRRTKSTEELGQLHLRQQVADAVMQPWSEDQGLAVCHAPCQS